MPKKKDLLIIGGILLAAVLLIVAAKMMPKTNLEDKKADVTLAPDAIDYLDATPVPEAKEDETKPSAAGPMPPTANEEVRGYVVITVGNRQYGDPIPMDRDKIITIKQDNGHVNKVHITPEKVFMESSSCDNQDCVQQGEIHVDTYKDRILGTHIICLPNNVSIEMVPAE